VKHVLGVASLIIVVSIAVLVARWIDENYVSHPRSERLTDSFRNSGYRPMAENAVREFAQMPMIEQSALRENLERNILSVAQWLDWLRESNVKVLCLGEDHEDTTRRFLARVLFSKLAVDALLLEVTPDEIGRITQELRWGREHVSLLGADIAGVIRAARAENPDVELIGIEETKSQRVARQRHGARGTRDETILNNLLGNFRYGSRYAILIGALHCRNKDQWLYGRAHRLSPRRIADQMVNVRVVGGHQDGAVEAFAYFLGKIGIHRSDFVIRGSKSISPMIDEWFELLGVTLDDFAVLMIFRDHPEVFDD
jgi:hypothetical protein